MVRDASCSHPAEAAAVEILDRLLDFRLRVHYERPIADDRLVERIAAKQHDLSVGVGLDRHVGSVAIAGRFRRKRVVLPLSWETKALAESREGKRTLGNWLPINRPPLTDRDRKSVGRLTEKSVRLKINSIPS
jgi:hypothetical protein